MLKKITGDDRLNDAGMPLPNGNISSTAEPKIAVARPVESSPAGYLSSAYAESLSEYGSLRHLPFSGGWLIERPIPGSEHRDAMGCYPLFTCLDWSGLGEDLEQLSERLVTVSLVADPFGRYSPEQMEKCFDLVFPFKLHFVTDLSQPLAKLVSRNHKRHVSKALRQVEVERCEPALPFLDEWVALYGFLRERHGVRGLSAFSRQAFARQLAVPGLVMFRARAGAATVGITLWYLDRGVAYYHLGASSPEGYRLHASYALFWHALNFFSSRAQWLDLGGVPGLEDDLASGLRQFKAGWATGTRPAYFCGKILQPEAYHRLCSGAGAGTYFPAYRAKYEL